MVVSSRAEVMSEVRIKRGRGRLKIWVQGHTWSSLYVFLSVYLFIFYFLARARGEEGEGNARATVIRPEPALAEVLPGKYPVPSHRCK